MAERSHTARSATERNEAKPKRERPRNGAGALANPFHLLLTEVRRDVDARLDALFQRKLTQAEPLGVDVVALVDALRDLTMRGGKRFRPALLVAAYHAVDDIAGDEIALDAGAAL